MDAADRFGPAYYRRFYEDDPVHGAAEVAHLVDGVLGLCRWWGVPVRTVLDVGAGPGLWGRCLAARHPAVGYHGVDVSTYACARWGHEQIDLATWRPDRVADVVVCQGVLQYLGDRAAAHAMGALADATGFVLYLEVPTVVDRRRVLDLGASDLDVHWRDGEWYRQRLERRFHPIGGGLWARRGCGLRFYELERPRTTPARRTTG